VQTNSLKLLYKKTPKPHIQEKAESSTTCKDNAFLNSKFSTTLRSVFVSFGLSSASNQIKFLAYYILSHDCQQKKQFFPYFLYRSNTSSTGLTWVSFLVKATGTPQTA